MLQHYKKLYSYLRRFGVFFLFILALPTIIILVKNQTNKMGREMRAVKPDLDSILITGATGGIGSHAALTMNAAGFTVFAGYRNFTKIQNVIKKGSFPNKIIPIRLDVTNPEDINQAFEEISNHVGENGLTALFTAGGHIPIPRPVEKTDETIFRKNMEIEYFGSINLTKKFIDLIRRSKNGGRLVYNNDCNMAPAFSTSSYGALFAMCAFINGYRHELKLKNDNVEVILISASLTYTPGILSWLDESMSDDVWPGLGDFRIETMNSLIGFGESPVTVSNNLVHAVLSKNPYSDYYPGEIMNYFSYFLGHAIYTDWKQFLMELMLSREPIMDERVGVKISTEKCLKEYPVDFNFLKEEVKGAPKLEL